MLLHQQLHLHLVAQAPPRPACVDLIRRYTGTLLCVLTKGWLLGFVVPLTQATKTFLDLPPMYGRPKLTQRQIDAIESGGAY